MEAPAGHDQGDAWSGQFPWREAGIAEQDFAPGLYVVATPLGNAADVTLRALWVLRMADCVAVEDTRTTAPLLARFGIVQRLVALHQHNEAERSGALLERLQRGGRVALVSDAGTPAISDPGALLVRAAHAAGVRVIPVPGASSLTAALSVAGIRSADIRFAGFAPARTQARRRHWSAIAAADAAVVVFEAPHRFAATARELAEALEPQRRIVVARELTKKFESIVETTAAALPGLAAAAAPRGEYVLVIDAPPAPPVPEAGEDAPGDTVPIDAVTRRWLLALAAEMPASRAAAVASKASGLPRALLYHALGQRGAEDTPGD
jgi:16S rRNA (cytidine1402-2'-O)-methyltransferase